MKDYPKDFLDLLNFVTAKRPRTVVPLVTYRVSGKDGRSIAAYKFGDPAEANNALSKSIGRTNFSKTLKRALIERYGAKCFIYLENMDESLLQVDHRVPYEIGGESDETNLDNYMLLSPSANRAKSWTCENCKNWQDKNRDFCSKCFWAHPENYEHIARKYERVIPLVFTGNELEDYNKLIKLSGKENASRFIKQMLHEQLN